VLEQYPTGQPEHADDISQRGRDRSAVSGRGGDGRVRRRW
jgi:hypothetical protein